MICAIVLRWRQAPFRDLLPFCCSGRLYSASLRSSSGSAVEYCSSSFLSLSTAVAPHFGPCTPGQWSAEAWNLFSVSRHDHELHQARFFRVPQGFLVEGFSSSACACLFAWEVDLAVPHSADYLIWVGACHLLSGNCFQPSCQRRRTYSRWLFSRGLWVMGLLFSRGGELMDAPLLGASAFSSPQGLVGCWLGR
jgi:hypothetical protein